MTPLRRFENRAALVTGAASGIGRATAIRLAAEGASVACVDLNAEPLAETVATITSGGGKAFALTCDVSSEEAVGKTVEAAVAELGKLDVLCNIAGILLGAHTHELRLSDWDRVIRVNLTGTFLMCRAAIPHLLETRGNIVNTSSTAALGSHPWMAAYAASKGGILSLSRSLSVEYVKQGLRVNTICPGGITTPLHVQLRFPKGADLDLIKGAMPFVPMVGPEDVASAYAFVASDDGKYMNGADIRVDGGALS